MPRRKRLWSYAAGRKGWMVTVFERGAGSLLYARAFDPTLAGGKGGYRRVSLGHRDREQATSYALEQAAKLRDGARRGPAGQGDDRAAVRRVPRP
ncbi:MAG: hypothetical protein ACREOF_03510 [Gemmatimonadales bacterium]